MMMVTSAKSMVMIITCDYWLKTKSSFDQNLTINLLSTADGKTLVVALSKWKLLLVQFENLPTNRMGSSSLNKLDNKPDWFLTTQDALLVHTKALWTEICLATLGTC